jgi:MFS family permease
MLLAEAPRPTSVHRRILLLSLLGWTFDFYDLILYTFLTREITEELGLTRFDHSVALGISFAATAAGGIACGFLADRFGRRTLVSWTILLYSAGSLLSGLAWSRESLFFARIVTGFGVGGEWAAGHALVAETFPPAHRGRAGALLQSGAPLGVGLAAFVGTVLVPRFGWRACLVGSSMTGVVAFLARRFMPESDLWKLGRADRFGAGLKRLLAGDASRSFYLGFVLTALNGASYWLTYSWMPEYLRGRGLALTTTGVWYGVIVAGELVGYTSFGFVSDRLGRRPAFTSFTVLMAAGLLPITVFWEGFLRAPELLLLSMFVVGLGTGTWSNFGPMLAELFPTSLRNTAMGAVLNLARGVQFGAPYLIALLEPVWGMEAGIGLAAAFAAAAGGFVWVLPETRARNLAVGLEERAGDRGV